MRAALFCHSSGRRTDLNTQQELQRQCRRLERYATQRGYSLEYCFFHTGNFDFEHPDDVLLHLLQYAQAQDFELVLVERMELFPVERPGCAPLLQLFFIEENTHLSVGVSRSPIDQQLPRQPVNAVVYWGADQD